MSLSHVNAKGEANMVDVSAKSVTTREAKAHGYISMSAATLAQVTSEKMAKGDVFAVARVAGIQAAKKCADLIPLCHPLALTKVDVQFGIDEANLRIGVSCRCKLSGKTGVEMEALTGASVALLTLFDMCKAMDPNMVISDLKVLEKRGGKTGHWQRESAS
jgi:cyclic pyranopterin phosphate synthase